MGIFQRLPEMATEYEPTTKTRARQPTIDADKIKSVWLNRNAALAISAKAASLFGAEGRT